MTREYLELLSPWRNSETGKFLPRLEPEGSWIARHLPAAVSDLDAYVVLAPGAEFGPAKQWPISHFAALAALLGEDGRKNGRRVVVMGLEKDREVGKRILAGCADGLNLCGETDLPAVVALLARADLLVSNDSGAMHIGAVLQRPQVALFGSSNPAWTAPLNRQAEIEYLGLDCSPCYRRECPLGHTNCLVEISPDQVHRQSRKLLQAVRRTWRKRKPGLAPMRISRANTGFP